MIESSECINRHACGMMSTAIPADPRLSGFVRRAQLGTVFASPFALETSMNHRATLIAWLNDAYAMETQLLPVLQNHAADVQNNPEAQRRIAEHVAETQRHADRMRQAVEQLGSTTSTIKSTLATVMGSVQSVATGIFSDELVKNALSDYAAEQFEIAAYKALIAAAEELG